MSVYADARPFIIPVNEAAAIVDMTSATDQVTLFSMRRRGWVRGVKIYGFGAFTGTPTIRLRVRRNKEAGTPVETVGLITLLEHFAFDIRMYEIDKVAQVPAHFEIGDDVILGVETVSAAGSALFEFWLDVDSAQA